MFGKAQLSRVSLLAALIVLGCAQRLFAQSAATNAPATNGLPSVIVLGLQGTPMVQKGTRWLPLQIGDWIPPGANVRTGPSDSMEIMLDEPGRIIALGSGSLIIIDLTKSRVNLEAGEMVASIRKTTKDNTSVIVNSRFGIATVRAADFRVTINPLPSIAVLDGIVEFEVARAQDIAPALQLREDAYVVAGPDNPIIRNLDGPTRSFITGQVDALVSSQGALADKFWPRSAFGACHTPTTPALIDPEIRPGRRKGFVAIEEYQHGSFVLAKSLSIGEYPPGSPACPIHSQRAHGKDASGGSAPVKKKPWEEE